MSNNLEDFDFLDDLMEDAPKKGGAPQGAYKKSTDSDLQSGLNFEEEDEQERQAAEKMRAMAAKRSSNRGRNSHDETFNQKNLNEILREEADSSNEIDFVETFSQAEREYSNNRNGGNRQQEEIKEHQYEQRVVDEDDFRSVELNHEEHEEHEDNLDIEEDLSDLPPAIREALEWEPPPPRSTREILTNEWIYTGWVGFIHIDQILTEAILTGASDVHITADLKVSMTRNGDIIKYNNYAIPDDETMHTLVHDGILNHQEQQIFNREFEYEGAYTLMYGPFVGRRTRLTIGKTFGKYFMVFRIISETIPKLETLGVEEELVNWSHYPNGLFLICGPTGSGKSTTLASILRNLQLTTRKKIISIEKPIEYVYPDDAPALVVQREVGEDTRGFYEGLTSAMRQSPNVILLGEVRNTEEVTELLRAAETGHLAISTMHTNSVATTINRIQNLFSGNEQRRIMSTLADTLRGIGNQVLVKKIDGEGRFAVRELLTVNEEIKQLIVAGDIQGIRDYQVKRKATMEHKLAYAVKTGKCKYEDAREHTAFPELFERVLRE